MLEHFLKIDCYDAFVGVKKSWERHFLSELTDIMALFIKKT